MKIDLRKKRLSRSAGGDLFIFILLAGGAAFTSLPLVYAISQAFKPLNELFLFPPQFFVRNPTLQNFRDLFVLMGNSWVPLSRYFFNSVFIIVAGLAGNLILASLAAYPLSVHEFPGQKFFNEMIVLSLMFARQVTRIPNYLTTAYLGWVDTYAAVIVPTWGTSLGLYLMKKFMDSMVPRDIIESARIDEASEMRIWWQIVMPIVKPAWLTLIILTFQRMWGVQQGGGRMRRFIYSEKLKTLPYAMKQVLKSGIARRGAQAAIMLIMMAVPITIFIINQSKVVKTMGTSGMD